MSREGSFLRALLLVLVLAAMMALLGTPQLMDELSLTQFSRPLAVFAGMAVVGALVVSLPERLRRWHEDGLRSSWQDRLRAFAAGILAMLGFMLAGAGELDVLCGVFMGGLGALTFVACAWITALAVVRLCGRRHA